jgi:hypothetical protein
MSKHTREESDGEDSSIASGPVGMKRIRMLGIDPSSSTYRALSPSADERLAPVDKLPKVGPDGEPLEAVVNYVNVNSVLRELAMLREMRRIRLSDINIEEVDSNESPIQRGQRGLLEALENAESKTESSKPLSNYKLRKRNRDPEDEEKNKNLVGKMMRQASQMHRGATTSESEED